MFPVNMEVALLEHILYPIELHIHGFQFILTGSTIGNYISCWDIYLYEGGWLGDIYLLGIIVEDLPIFDV